MTSALCAFYFFRSKRKDVFLDISSFNLQQGKTISFALFFKKLFPVLYSVSNILIQKKEKIIIVLVIRKCFTGFHLGKVIESNT